MNGIRLLKNEHIEKNKMISDIEKLMDDGIVENYEEIGLKLEDFNKFWTHHEEYEEREFANSKNGKKKTSSNPSLPTETMLIEQHRELRGHWRIIKEALDTGDAEVIGVSLETDGKMMINKIRKHMEIEEEYLDSLS